MTVLRMVSLLKRNGSDNWYYRRTIPADVRRTLEKATKKARRPGWHQTHIMISTGTPDRAVAKTAGAEIAANVERQFKALRDGPKALTAKQVSALSGIAYRAFAEGLEDNPGLTSQQWLQVADANDAARRGEFSLGARLGIFKNEDERRDASMEHRFNKQSHERPADALLSGFINSCTENGFVRNAIHPEFSAALRMEGSAFPVM